MRPVCPASRYPSATPPKPLTEPRVEESYPTLEGRCTMSGHQSQDCSGSPTRTVHAPSSVGGIYATPSLQHRHGVRLKNGVAEVLPNQTFDVVVANFSRRERRLPKHTFVGCAKRKSLEILTPERRVAEGMAHAPHQTDLTDQVREVEVGRSNSDKITVGGGEVDTDELSRLYHPATVGNVPRRKSIPKIHRRIGKKIDLSYIEDDKLRGHVLEMLRKHSSLWSGALERIRATEHRIAFEPGTKPIRSMPYHKGPAMREMVAKEVNKILNAGVIEPAGTEWASPVVLVRKNDRLSSVLR